MLPPWSHFQIIYRPGPLTSFRCRHLHSGLFFPRRHGLFLLLHCYIRSPRFAIEGTIAFLTAVSWGHEHMPTIIQATTIDMSLWKQSTVAQ